MKIRQRMTHGLLALLAWCVSAHAGAPQPFSDELLLDSWGIRGYLLDKGVDFRVGYVSETATNVKGGDQELWRYADQWTFAATLDLEKIVGLKQAQFRITVTDRNGRSLSTDAGLDSLQEVQEIYGRGQTWRWTQFWYDQKYFSGLVDWKIGRLNGGEDFAAFSCDFINLTFCGSPPGNLVGGYWYNWPVSQWGSRIRLSLPGFGYTQVGAYQVNPNALQTQYAIKLGIPAGTTGVLVPLEAGWLPTFGHGLAGSYKFGVWYNSSQAADVVENTNGQVLAIYGGSPLIHSGQYGAYINFLQRVMSTANSSSKRGVSIFFNATYADRWTSRLDNQFAAGALYTGPFSARPADELGFAVGRTHVNSRIGTAQAQVNAAGLGPIGVQSSEYEAELYYSLHAASWIELRPSVQYVHQPGGVAQNTDDVILGLRLSVNF